MPAGVSCFGYGRPLVACSGARSVQRCGWAEVGPCGAVVHNHIQMHATSGSSAGLSRLWVTQDKLRTGPPKNCHHKVGATVSGLYVCTAVDGSRGSNPDPESAQARTRMVRHLSSRIES